MSDKPQKTTPKPRKKLPKTKAVVEKQARSNKAQLNQRVSEVQALLLEGYTRSYVVQFGSKWKVSDRQIDDYIKMATINIKEVSMAGLKDDLAIIVSAMWDTFRKAKAANNIGEMRQSLLALAKLKGYDESTVNHVIEDKRELQDMSNEDLDAILAQEAKH